MMGMRNQLGRILIFLIDLLIMSFELSDDDILFESNIDPDVEWRGLHFNNSINVEQETSELGSQFSDGTQSTHHGHPIFNKRMDVEDPKFELGMCFSDTATLRQAIRQHAIVNGRDVTFTLNDRHKVQAKCKHETCSWLIYASKVQNEDTMQVKTFNGTHHCPRKQRVSHANAKWLADRYKDKIWTDPKWPVDSMLTIMQKENKLLFNKSQLYRAKKKVEKIGCGTDGEQYAMLWSYVEEIRKF
ncbi:UNVERIFIED_CONTAM: hypothetical protein Sradi_1870900 [Sesamum radiatum]|uniref:Transposase MuDR plant domain-containing protein n=1 Tax=Sesamum radiatum TaxID=300843 RepID=A0AAW2TYI4_SESRA